MYWFGSGQIKFNVKIICLWIAGKSIVFRVGSGHWGYPNLRIPWITVVLMKNTKKKISVTLTGQIVGFTSSKSKTYMFSNQTNLGLVESDQIKLYPIKGLFG